MSIRYKMPQTQQQHRPEEQHQLVARVEQAEWEASVVA